MKEIIIFIVGVIVLFLGICYFIWTNNHYEDLFKKDRFLAGSHLMLCVIVTAIGSISMLLMICKWFGL